MRRGFVLAPLLFEVFRCSDAGNGTSDALISAARRWRFRFGIGTLRTYFASAGLMEGRRHLRSELYAQLAQPSRTGIDIYTQSNPLPIVKRPALMARLFSSNGGDRDGR